MTLPGELAAFVRTGAVPGLIAAVVTPARVEIHRLGSMPAAGSDPPGPETPFLVGSLSKVFTAVALADLVREGRIGLDDPVEPLLPAGVRLPRPGGEAIRVADLAMHTSGLPVGERSDAARQAAIEGGWAYLDPRLASVELAAPPGERFLYSNVGMALLGRLLERADGRPYEELVRARVLAPLGMDATRVTLAPGEPEPLFWFRSGIFAPAGGFSSHLEDLVRFASAALGGAPPPLDAALALTMTRRGTDAGGRPLYLGWHEDRAERLMHSGLWHAYLGVDRARAVAVVLLCSGQTPQLDALGSAALACAAGDPVPFPA